MAIITGYQPAKLPQNQQWFQLPLDQMHNILSDAQTKADLAKSELDFLSSQSFANLADDAASATAARTWLKQSATKLVEQYGEDPRGWEAGLTKLKKEIAYRFDPNTGDIGAMQARVDNVKSQQTALQEQYKDQPELAKYAISNIKIDPLESAMNDKVNFGVTAPQMYQHVPEKEINEFINGAVDNVMATEYERYGYQAYATLDEFNKAYASGTLDGITEEKVTTALMMQVPDTYLTSYFQLAKARGLPDDVARQELNPLNEDGSLNPMNTIASKILGAAYGKAYQKSNLTYDVIKDEVALAQAKKAAEDIKAQLVPWNFSTMQYSYDAPWGTSETSVKEFITNTDEQLNNAKNEVLMNITENERAGITPESLVNAERGTSADGTTTTWTITKEDGTKQIVAASDGVMDTYKTTYTNAAVYKALATEAKAQADTAGNEYAKSLYGVDLLNGEAIPEVSGMSKAAVIDAYSGYKNYLEELSSVSNGVKESLEMVGGSALALIGAATNMPSLVTKGAELAKYNSIQEKYKNEIQEFNKLVHAADVSGNSAELDKAFDKYGDAILAAGSKTKEVLEGNAKIQLQGVSTTDFGGTGEENEKWQKELQGIFGSYANMENFEVYTPGSTKSTTFKTAVAEAAKAKGIKFEDINLQDGQGIQLSGPIKRTMQPMPDGTFHWQASYAVKAGDKSVTLNVLFPSDAGSSVSNSFLEALDNSPEARAIESLLYAKSFNLHEFKIPGTNMTIRGNGNYVNLHQEDNIYSDKPITYDEAKNILTKQYQIEEIQRANPGMTKQEAQAKYAYYESLQNSGSSPAGLPEGGILTKETPIEE